MQVQLALYDRIYKNKNNVFVFPVLVNLFQFSVICNNYYNYIAIVINSAAK